MLFKCHARQATQLLSSTTLRNILGTLTLSQILSDREHISQTMQRLMDEATGTRITISCSFLNIQDDT